MVGGTEEDIKKIKARIASLTVYEEVMSMYMREKEVRQQ